MSTQTTISRETDSLAEDEMVSPGEWVVARKDLLTRGKQLTLMRDDISRQRRALPWVIDKEYGADALAEAVTRAERSTIFSKQSGYRLVCSAGVPLIVAVYLLLQLHKLPNSSLSYSLLYPIISLLFNLSSSAILRVF